jgi:hypothetical protein
LRELSDPTHSCSHRGNFSNRGGRGREREGETESDGKLKRKRRRCRLWVGKKCTRRRKKRTKEKGRGLKSTVESEGHVFLILVFVLRTM